MDKNQIETERVAPNRVEVLDMKSIIVGHRFRQDKGDIKNLQKSIEQSGLIHPIAVKESTDGMYHLIAGGRRYQACKNLGWNEITCNIYPEEMSQLQRQIIELCENIDRKDMTYDEEVAITKQIHMAMQKLLGKKGSGKAAIGHSLQDTADMLGSSFGKVCGDIKLAEAIEVIPELKDCKNKREAMKKLKDLERGYTARKSLEKFEEEMPSTESATIKKSLLDSFMVADFFEGVKKVQDNCLNLVEVDPPYAIDLEEAKRGSVSKEDYTEWKREEFIEKSKRVMKEAYRCLKDDGWIIWWFGPDPWFEPIACALEETGFKLCRIPGIWIKTRGQTNQPDRYLANTYETFFYARKGDPKIWKRGRPNYFRFRELNPSEKTHTTEKPTDLELEIYKTFVPPGSKIMIPFLGSGRGIVSAYKAHCLAFGYEILKKHKDNFITKLDEIKIETE